MATKTWKQVNRLDDRGNPCGINIEDEEGNIVARLPDGAILRGGKAFKTQHVNARYIQYAPDMLTAIKELLTFLPDGKADYETLSYARSIVFDIESGL